MREDGQTGPAIGRAVPSEGSRSLEKDLVLHFYTGSCVNQLQRRPPHRANGIDVYAGLQYSVGALIRSQEEVVYDTRL